MLDDDDDNDNSIDLESLQDRVEKIEIAMDVVRGRDSVASGKGSIPSSLTKKVRGNRPTDSPSMTDTNISSNQMVLLHSFLE